MGLKTKVGVAGLVLALGVVTAWEGYKPTAYLDPVGIPTVCYGHTGREVVLGKKESLDKCHDLLSADLRASWDIVSRFTLVPLTNYQQAAFTSFVFNVGSENFRKSKMLRLINQNRIDDACHELPRWVYAKGKKLQGLVNRRAAEMKLCLGG